MKFDDIRQFIDFLDHKGDLRRITEKVSPELEITEIVDRVVKDKGPALLFENVEGYDDPILINIFGSHQRMAWALGVNNINEITDRVRGLLNLVEGPPEGLMNKINLLKNLFGIARTKPNIISQAPCQEVVYLDADADFSILPALKCWPLDAGKYITLPLVITKDGMTGRRNVGTYRMQIFDSKTAGMHWQTHKVGSQHYRQAEENEIKKIEVAISIGGDPTTVWSGSLPIPPNMDEIVVSGILRGKSVSMVKCKTVDLEVPAYSEYVLEGYVIPGELRNEGPFGDHTGYYSPADEYPVFHLTAITHRKNPIYLTTIVGRPPSEDYYMGSASTKVLFPALQMTLPEIVDINMPAEGAFHNILIVSIKKAYPGHARKVMYALWGLGLLMLTKTIIVLDSYVNVHDMSEVAWRVATKINPSTDLVMVEGPADDLEHATTTPKYGSKIGLDATTKGKKDGRSKEWPDEIIMQEDIKNIVTKKWDNYRI